MQPALRCARAKRDKYLQADIQRMNETNFNVYSMIKVWKQLHRVGVAVARCTVARLMKQLNIQGVRRGKRIRTTISDNKTICPSDKVNRQFRSARPNQLWVSDFTPYRGTGQALRIHLSGLAICGVCD